MKFAPLLFIAAIISAVTFAAAPAAHAALLVYEGFDSSTAVDGSSIVGFQGESSVGLGANTWDISSPAPPPTTLTAEWQSAGLSFAGAFATTGGALHLATNDRLGAWIQPDAAMGTTRFMSFLIRPDDNNSNNSSIRFGGYDDDGLAIAPNVSGGGYLATRSGGKNGQVRAGGAASGGGGADLLQGQTFLVVGSLSGLDGVGGAANVAEMWIFSQAQWETLNSNPSAFDTNAELTAIPQGVAANQVWTKLTVTDTSALDVGGVDFVGFINNVDANTIFDELRIGSELSDVLFPASMQVIPEPSSLSLVALAAAVFAGLAYRRRLS